jgi:hypothetical protein
VFHIELRKKHTQYTEVEGTSFLYEYEIKYDKERDADAEELPYTTGNSI